MMGISLEDSGNVEEASTIFHKAWNEATEQKIRAKLSAEHIPIR